MEKSRAWPPIWSHQPALSRSVDSAASNPCPACIVGPQQLNDPEQAISKQIGTLSELRVTGPQQLNNPQQAISKQIGTLPELRVTGLTANLVSHAHVGNLITDTIGPVNIQTSASWFWGKQIHQTRDGMPKKYLNHANI
jgi:hypothetical protein